MKKSTPQTVSLLLEFLQEYSQTKKDGDRFRIHKVVAKHSTIITDELMKDLKLAKDPGDRLEAAFVSAVIFIYGQQTIAGIIGQSVQHWYYLFHDDLAAERNAPTFSETSMEALNWELVGNLLVGGFFERARSLILKHPVLKKDDRSSSESEYTQAHCVMELLDLMETRSALASRIVCDRLPSGDRLEATDFLKEFGEWRDEQLTAFDSFVSKKRTLLGNQLADNLLDMTEILFGKEETLQRFASDRLELFIGKIFHDPYWITSHLQLKISFDTVVGKSGPSFSSWNQSLTSLLKDLFTLDGVRLNQHVSDPSLALDCSGRLVMGIVLMNFFEEHGSLWKQSTSELKLSFFDYYGEAFCAMLQDFTQILHFVLCCPGLSNSQAIHMLTTSISRDRKVWHSLLEESRKEDFERKWIPLLEENDLLFTVRKLIGEAHHLDGNVSLAAYSLKSCGVPNDQNKSLTVCKNLMTNFLENEEHSVFSAMRVERLNVEELLSSGSQRREIWNYLSSELKSILDLNTQNDSILAKLEAFTNPDAQVIGNDLYGMMIALTKLISSLPRDTSRWMRTKQVNDIEEAFNEVLRHPFLDQKTKGLVAMKALHLVYLHGSHLSGSLLFSNTFTKEIIQLVAKRRSWEDLQDLKVTQTVQDILCTILSHGLKKTKE